MKEWHDLRKNPEDLPETCKYVWVVLSDNPNVVNMDTYDPNERGMKSAWYGLDGKHEFVCTGWYENSDPAFGQVIYWMEIEPPEPPKED